MQDTICIFLLKYFKRLFRFVERNIGNLNMWRFSKYLAVISASTIKFVGGPLAGIAMSLKWWETAICSAAGMMITVTVIVYGGNVLSLLKIGSFKSKKPKKIFTKTTRLGIKVKSSLGLWGISFLTPLLFTPIVGSFLAISFKYPKFEIFSKMLVCGLFWGVIQALTLKFIKALFI
jgi:hypothetical protein